MTANYLRFFGFFSEWFNAPVVLMPRVLRQTYNTVEDGAYAPAKDQSAKV
jgi:hypothetical protein